MKAVEELQKRRQSIESKTNIREFVFGIQDGLLTTVGLVAGVQGAQSTRIVVIITGFAGMVAGAISMAAGAYISSKSEKDIIAAEIGENTRDVRRAPYVAEEGLLRALQDEGLDRPTSYRVVKLLAQHDAVFLNTFQEKVLGLTKVETTRPIRGSLVMALSFALGAFIPLLPYLLGSGPTALMVAVALSALTLFGVGWFKGVLAAQRPWLAGLEFVGIALGAAALGYVIGIGLDHLRPLLGG